MMRPSTKPISPLRILLRRFSGISYPASFATENRYEVSVSSPSNIIGKYLTKPLPSRYDGSFFIRVFQRPTSWSAMACDASCSRHV